MIKDSAYKVYLLLVYVIIILGIVGIGSNYYLQKNNIENKTQINVLNYHDRLDTYIVQQANMMKSYLEFISQKKILQNDFLNSDKSKLYKDSIDIFQHLNTNSDITHFYFIKTTGEILLRVHDLGKSGDIVDRYTFKEAKKKDALFYGLEFGIKKNYTLRVVIPWIIEGKTIGFIELGKEINKINVALHQDLGLEIIYAVNKTIFHNLNLLETRNSYVIYQTLKINDQIISFIDEENYNLPQWLEIDHNYYVAYLLPLIDVSNQTLGSKVLLINITNEYYELLKSVFYYTSIMAVGTILLLIVVFFLVKRKQNIIDRTYKELEAKTLEQNNLLELFDKGDSVFFKWNNDSHWSINYVSSNVFNLLGYTKEEFLNSQILYADCIHKDDLPRVFEEVKDGQISKENFFIHQPYRIITKDGRVKWVHDYTVLDKDIKGNIIHFLGYIIDITENKINELKLAAQKEEFETIFKFTKDGIAILDLDTHFLEFNDAYLHITGYTREELHTKTCYELTPPEFKEKSHEAIETVIKDGFIENFQKDCFMKNGKRISTNMSISMLPDHQRLLLVMKDVTSLKQLEDQAKLASMGEMIGNIAHQWRQPLSIISTNATGLMMQQEYGLLTDEKLTTSCNQINNYAQYLSQTIDDFRNFIKGDDNFSHIHVNQILHEALNIVSPSITNNYINLILQIEDDLMIFGNKNELEQAMINILNNAKDILIEKVQEDERTIFISTKLLDEHRLELSICDNGGGIPNEIIDKIFEPYFTTKHQSQGTGLGLSMVDKIIREKHHLELRAYNKEFSTNKISHYGACFEIIFQSE